jgi:hypothetical protein
MARIIRSALIGWGVITALIVFEFIWIYSRHGFAGFDAVLQDGPFTNLPITLASVALTWLLAGFLLWLVLAGKITKRTSLIWAGFFVIGFLYLNILRERVRYGDIGYYVEAAFALVNHQPLPDTYLYSPLWATLLSFLTPLGEDGILLICWIANFLSLLLFYFLLVRTLELYRFNTHAAAITATLFILVNMAVIRTLLYVQVNLHVMNFILLSLLFFGRRTFLSAFMLALAIHFKVSPALLVFAFLLEFNWKWFVWLIVSALLIVGFTVAIYGIEPYVDFINNSLLLSTADILIMRNTSFDSAIGVALSYFRADPAIVRLLVLLAKGITALVTLFLSIRSRGFVPEGERNERLFNSIIPLFVAMTLLSPLVWEHHGVFLTLPFLLLLKKLESPLEWTLYSAVDLLVFLMPTFDYFPWSYARLAAILILLWLVWTSRGRSRNTFFPILNAWTESIFGTKPQAKVV